MKSELRSTQQLFGLMFNCCIDRARVCFPSGNYTESEANSVIDWLYVAASIAWCMNPGFLRSLAVEKILSNISSNLLGPSVISPLRGSSPRVHVVHIATAVSLKGGHTRVIARWIDNCSIYAPDQVHHLLLTGQGDSEIPAWLAESVRKTGGQCSLLDRNSGWIGCAKALRGYVFDHADAVVLHVHPNDAVVNLALEGVKDIIPVYLFNHADHVFSLGVGLASRVLDFRNSGKDFSLRYRYVNSTVVPLPLIVGDIAQNRSVVRVEARKRLNISADALVALTIGDEYKYKDALGYSFLGCIRALLTLESGLTLLAVGIPFKNEWAALAAEFQNRFVPVGTVTDRNLLNDYYSAADVYLEGFPFSSLTAMIDAGLNGLPIQRMHNLQLPILSGDDIALDSSVCIATNCGEYISGVRSLLAMDPVARENLGASIRSLIVTNHCGEIWFKTFIEPMFNLASTKSFDGHIDRPLELSDSVEKNNAELDALAEFQLETRGAFVVTLISMAQSPLSLFRLQKILLLFLLKDIRKFSIKSVAYSTFTPFIISFLRYLPWKRVRTIMKR